MNAMVVGRRREWRPSPVGARFVAEDGLARLQHPFCFLHCSLPANPRWRASVLNAGLGRRRYLEGWHPPQEIASPHHLSTPLNHTHQRRLKGVRWKRLLAFLILALSLLVLRPWATPKSPDFLTRL
jgi:hypothetical protein